jgi:hypothetical protein
VFPSIMFAAWFVGFRWLPLLFSRVAVALLPDEERAWLAAAMEVSLQTGEPVPSLRELRQERAEYQARTASGELGVLWPAHEDDG